MTDEERAKLRARLNGRENGDVPVPPVRSVHPAMEQNVVNQTSYGESGVPFGITSMVLGIVALLMLFTTLRMSAIIAAIIGIVMAGMAVTRGYDGGMQKAGKIMSWIVLIIVIVMIVASTLGIAAFSSILQKYSQPQQQTQQQQYQQDDDANNPANNPEIWNRTNMIIFSR